MPSTTGDSAKETPNVRKRIDVRLRLDQKTYIEKSCRNWWAAYYPSDNMQRPTGTSCDGCHSVNYDVHAKQVTEWNVLGKDSRQGRSESEFLCDLAEPPISGPNRERFVKEGRGYQMKIG